MTNSTNRFSDVAPTMRAAVLTVMLSLCMIGASHAAKKDPPIAASPADQPTGFLLMQTIGRGGPGQLPAAIKRFDDQQVEWLHIGDGNELIRLKAGPHRVGMIYSAGANLFAVGKLVGGAPLEEHTTTIEISKDRITIVPHSFETGAGGFKWKLTLNETHVVIPSRHLDTAVEEFVQIFEDDSLRGIPSEHLGMIIREAVARSDPRVIPGLQKIAANPVYEKWRTTAKYAARDIGRQTQRKKN